MGKTDALSRLVDLPTEQAELYQQYRRRIKQAQADGYLQPDMKQRLIGALQNEFRAELESLKHRRREALSEITARKQHYGQSSTQAATQKVKWALEHGMDIHALCGQLAVEGDRQAFTALREQMPYLLAAKMIEFPNVPTSKQASYASEIIDSYEMRTWTGKELEYQQEARAAGIGSPLLEHNEKQLETWITSQHLPNRAPIEHLYHFCGLPDDPEVPKGLLSLADPDDAPAPASWVPGMMRRQA